MNKGKNINNYQFTGDFLYSRITEDANGAWQELSQSRTFDQPGYLYIITANENKDNVDIFFDDIEVNLHQTRIASGNDYYPFGLPMVERSYQRENYRFDYQGLFSEKDDETGWNAFQLRQYDARIGRFLSPDPRKQFWSPYLAMGNNPVIGIDPTGGECPTCLANFFAEGGKLLDEVLVTATPLLEETAKTAGAAIAAIRGGKVLYNGFEASYSLEGNEIIIDLESRLSSNYPDPSQNNYSNIERPSNLDFVDPIAPNGQTLAGIPETWTKAGSLGMFLAQTSQDANLAVNAYNIAKAHKAKMNLNKAFPGYFKKP